MTLAAKLLYLVTALVGILLVSGCETTTKVKLKTVKPEPAVIQKKVHVGDDVVIRTQDGKEFRLRVTQDIGQSLGTIGVVSGRFTPKVRFQAPERVKGAKGAGGRTAGHALGQMWLACGEAMVRTFPTIVGPYVIGYGCVVATPFVAIGGAMVGDSRANRAAKRARKSEVAQLRSVIDPALAALANEKPLHHRLLEHARTQAYHAVVSLKDRGPTSPRKRVRYKTLTSQGIDTVLEVTVPRVEVTPDNALVLTAHVRLIRITDNEALYANTYTFETAPQTVWQWTANGGDGFRATLVNGYEGLADKIAGDLFSSSPLLKRHGAKKGTGSTPLHHAAWKESTTVVERLLAEDADVNARDEHGSTPLHIAAKWKDTAIPEMLLAEGANVDAKDRKGQTPLHIAATFGRTAIVELMFTKGADVDEKDEKGKTPLDYATDQKVIELLKQHAGGGGLRILLMKPELP